MPKALISWQQPRLVLFSHEQVHFHSGLRRDLFLPVLHGVQLILAHFDGDLLDRKLDKSRLFELSIICLLLLGLQKVLCLCSQVDSEGLHW